MVRRLLGLLLSVLVLSAATSEFYNVSDKNVLPISLRFEASYVGLDPGDDLGDTPYPDGIFGWSPRGNAIIKLMLSESVRTFRFLPPTPVIVERPTRSRLSNQDLFRLEEVYRI